MHTWACVVCEALTQTAVISHDLLRAHKHEAGLVGAGEVWVSGVGQRDGQTGAVLRTPGLTLGLATHHIHHLTCTCRCHQAIYHWLKGLQKGLLLNEICNVNLVFLSPRYFNVMILHDTSNEHSEYPAMLCTLIHNIPDSSLESFVTAALLRSWSRNCPYVMSIMVCTWLGWSESSNKVTAPYL